jgi:uncharacterized protein (DUF885 family)
MKTLLTATFAAIALACGSPRATLPERSSTAGAGQTQTLTEYLNGEFEEELARKPEWATSMGRKDNYDKLDDHSEKGQRAELEWRRESVREMKARFDRSRLGAEDQTSYDIWAAELDAAEVAAPFRRHAYIFGYRGPHTELPNLLMIYHKVDDRSDMMAYNARLIALGTALDQASERAKLAAADGIRPPTFGYERTISESQRLISGQPFESNGPDSPLWADAKAKIKNLLDARKLDAMQAKELEAQTREALLSRVQPSYLRLIQSLKADISRASSGKTGALMLPNGHEWYAAALRLQTTTDMKAEEIHAIGLREVARLHKEMNAVREQVRFSGELMAFFEFMRTDRQFYLPNTDEARARYLRDSEHFIDAMKPRLPDYFGRLPKADLVVKRVEAFREMPGGAAHYYPPTPDGKQPGIFYSHMSDMSALATWTQEATTYHESVPGHHLQIAIATELTGLPTFRTQYGYTAYSEGWGLYAEALAKEMGFYRNPYNDFGRLSSELWRAVRLVADTGIHDLGWTEEEAVKYALDNSPRPEAAIRSEIRRFILWPGQATSYKIGAMKILSLREESKRALGAKFDIRRFHDVVINSGGLPLSVLERRVKSWVEAETRR